MMMERCEERVLEYLVPSLALAPLVQESSQAQGLELLALDPLVPGLLELAPRHLHP